jgi:hypothetical protein
MAKKTEGKPVWLECPFRVICLPAKEGVAPGACDRVICEASDAVLNDPAGGQEQHCPSCDIPGTLAHPRACLYLVPFRVLNGVRAKSYYACRWRLDFKPLFFPENIDWCRACRHWFPRPPEHLVFNQVEFSRLALKLYSSPAAPYIHPALKDLYSTIPDDRKKWHQALWIKIKCLMGNRD